MAIWGIYVKFLQPGLGGRFKYFLLSTLGEIRSNLTTNAHIFTWVETQPPTRIAASKEFPSQQNLTSIFFRWVGGRKPPTLVVNFG